MPAGRNKPILFVGSSTANLSVARSVADCLKRRNFDAKVWDEFVFRFNESIFDGLIRVAREVDFAVFVWGADDVTTTETRSIPSPRDNVVFEAGLFVGSLGKDRVFIVADSTQSLKIPSDYAGIMRATYDGVDTGQYSVSAVSLACNEIESSIRGISISPDLLRLRGRWKSRFASGPVRDHPVLIDDVEITAEIEGLQIAGTSQNMPYLGRATVHHGNQIIGHWTHPSDRSLARALSCSLSVQQRTCYTVISVLKTRTERRSSEPGYSRRRTTALSNRSSPIFCGRKVFSGRRQFHPPLRRRKPENTRGQRWTVSLYRSSGF